MVLTKYDLKELCRKNNLIEGYETRNIQSNSYDLRMGSQFYCYRYEDGDKINIRTLGLKTEDDEFEIPPDAICYVITEEQINMPLNLTAEIALAFGLIKKGVMFAKQPPIDPGYTGKIVALLHNLSNEPIKIRRKDHILSIVFYELKQEIKQNDGYHSSYQNMKTLRAFGMKNKSGALFALKHDMEEQAANFQKSVEDLNKRQKKSNEKRMSIVSTANTITIAVLTILITILAGGSFWFSTKEQEKEPELENVNVRIDKEQIGFGEYTVILDGAKVDKIEVEGKTLIVELETGGD